MVLANKIIKEQIPIAEIRDDTYDTKTFRFNVPEGFTFIPGQYVMISCKHIKDGVEKEIKRSYSMSSSPTEEGYIDLTIKLYPEGEFTPLLFKKSVGDVFTVLGPVGKFVFDESCTEVGLLGAGSGITPLRSIMKYCIDKKLPIKSTLIYSSKTPQDIIFMEEFEKWNSFENVKCINTITRPDGHEWSGLTGRITPELVKQYINTGKAHFYICGPGPFVDSMVALLKGLDVPPERIKKEQW
jgi:glycine betaine catabolism B